MKTVCIAKNPNLRFLRATPSSDFRYPFLLNADGSFNWIANRQLMLLAGGDSIYGTYKAPETIVNHAYSLGIFYEYLTNIKAVATDLTDNEIFKFLRYLQHRNISDETIRKHIRRALGHLVYIQESNPNLNLITSEPSPSKKYQIHFKYGEYRARGRSTRYIEHASMSSLSVLHSEIEYVRDDEFVLWLDSIHSSSMHPNPSPFIISRWSSISHLLEGTGSRISELGNITRTSIKEAYQPLSDAEQMVQLKGIPIRKGKYKGNFRNIPISNGSLQIVNKYISMIEETWPNIDHDYLYVNAHTGQRLSNLYLKNYTLRVIQSSTSRDALAHLHNHSFRHRYITLNIARTLQSYRDSGTFTNILSVAATAVRKLTLHASNDALSQYVHLAQERNRAVSTKDARLPSSSTSISEIKYLAARLLDEEIDRDSLQRLAQLIKDL